MNPNKAKLYFHIGTPKTGTTSIQRALRMLNGLSSSYNYPEPMITESHLLESAILLKECGATVDLSWAPEVMAALRVSSGITFSDIILKWGQFSPQMPVDPLNESTPTVLSCEFLIKYLNSDNILTRLRELLDGFDVVFILYLRRLDEHCNSEVLQTLKEGLWSSNDSLKILKSNRRHTLTRFHKSLPRTLLRIQKIFGLDSIILRPFERYQLFNNDVVFDFINVIGAPTNFNYKNSVQNKTPPVDFLLYFSDRFGGPHERDPIAHKVFRQIAEGSKIYELASSETSNIYSWIERTEMLSDVVNIYRDLSAMHAENNQHLFVASPPSHSDLCFSNTMHAERISYFNALISESFASLYKD